MLNERNIPLEEDGIEEEIFVEEELTITKAMWGDIGGNIANQTDLQNALDAKQDSLTEAQLNAVNSGITAGKVATYDVYADQIASKADQSALNAEATTRGEADTALGTRIDNEALARQQADNGLQSQIDAITSKSDVVDVVANYAALQAYDTSTLGNNDVVKVLDDETHEDALTYYRWSTTTQTWSYIGQEAPYYSKGQMDVKLAEKQDKLTAGANIQIQNGTISATDTTYTAGNGLNLNGTEFSADTNVLATKEDLEGYYTKPETDNLLAPKLEAELVAVLPPTGTEGKLYLTPKAHTTQTATGNPITATITEQAGKMESFRLDGDTFQQSYTGKNLANIGSQTGSYGVEFDYDQSNNTLRIHGTPTATFAVDTNVTNIELPAGTYTISLQSAAPKNIGFGIYTGGNRTPYAIAAGQTSRTITLDSDSELRDVYTTGLTVGVAIDFTVQIMLEKGGTATSFEPYVGGQPSPSPEYPQPIQTVTGLQTVEIVGKNLFDKDNMDIRNGYLYSTTFSYRTTNADRTFIVPCEPNTTYTISRSVITSSFRAAYIDLEPSDIPADASSETSLTCAGYIANNSGTSITITTSATAKSLLVHYGNTNTDGVTLIDQSVDTIMVEKSASANDYAPYSKQTLTLDLGSIELCKLGTYQDYIWKDGEDWKVHKASSKTTITNLSTITGVNSTSENTTRVNFSGVLNPVPNGLIASDRLYSKSDHFPAISNYNGDSVGIYFSNTSSGDTWFRANKTEIGTTEDSVKAWLANNPVKLYYPIPTATDTTITDTALIAQLEAIRTASLQNGANTITNTATGSNLAGDMEIGYYGFNPRNRYDKWLWLDLNNNYEQIGS